MKISGNMVKVSEYFDVRYGNSLSLSDMEKSIEGVNFISRTSSNNGVVARVKELENISPNPAYSITVAASGSVMESFFQEEPYYTAYHVFVLMPKIKFTKNELLYYCACLRANKYRYNYGRQANKTLKDLELPEIEKIPKWVNEIKIPEKPDNNSIFKKNIDLDTKNWKYFELSELFKIKGSKTTPIKDLEYIGIGNYPYVTTQATRNGVSGFFDCYTEEGGVITVDSAVLGYSSYQETNFSASDHVEKLIPKFNMNKYIALFLVTVLNKEQFRYNYGRKCSQTRLKLAKIKLPVTDSGKPDFNYMEDYMKSLKYSSALK